MKAFYIIFPNRFIAQNNLSFILLSGEEEVVYNLYEVVNRKLCLVKSGGRIERSAFVMNEEDIIRNIC
jgi:peroxiredoxin